MNLNSKNRGQMCVSLLAVCLVLSATAVVGVAAYGQAGATSQPDADPYSYAFTYQGQLKDAGGPVNGLCDLQFGLWDAASDGTPVGGVLVVPNVTLVDGLFTARLDFGATAHTGGARWLEVAVRCPAGGGSWVTLTPRQELTGAPAALALALPFTAQGVANTALFSIANTGNGPAMEAFSPLGTGLRIAEGAYGVVVEAAGGDAVHVDNAGLAGLSVSYAGGNGVGVGSAGSSGLYVGNAVINGVSVGNAGEDGVNVWSAGSAPGHTPSALHNGFEVTGAEGYGLYVGNSGQAGVYVGNAGQAGVYVGNAGEHGLYVDSAGYDGLAVGNAADDGVSVSFADSDGAYVYNAGESGVYVFSAGKDGLHVYSAGTPPDHTASALNNGVEVEGAEGHGLYVGNAGGYGLHVGSAGNDGAYIGAAASAGLWVNAAGTDGVNVTGNNWAGFFWGSIYVDGGCTGCVLSEFGRNAGHRPLQPGDIVTIEGMDASTLDNAPMLWQVVPAEGGGTVVGVVRGRAQLDLAREGEKVRDGQTGRRLVPRDGAAQPGDYLTIVIYGPMQVRAAASALGAIAPGTRLAVGTDGLARPLRAVTVEGVTLAESAPLIGIALSAPDADGLVWVLVNPQ